MLAGCFSNPQETYSFPKLKDTLADRKEISVDSSSRIKWLSFWKPKLKLMNRLIIKFFPLSFLSFSIFFINFSLKPNLKTIFIQSRTFYRNKISRLSFTLCRFRVNLRYLFFSNDSRNEIQSWFTFPSCLNARPVESGLKRIFFLQVLFVEPW